MGKKRPMASIATAPVFPFPAAADEPDHFSDYGFDPQLLRFTQGAKRAATRRHQQPPPLEPARFKLQKPISKKHQPKQHNKQRRRWWSSAAEAALHFFKRPSSNPTARDAGTPAPSSSYSTAAASPTRPLYLADHGGDDEVTLFACTCWAPAMRSGHLAAAEFGAASAAVSYVSLRDINLGGSAGGAGAGAPAMPIYLVT